MSKIGNPWITVLYNMVNDGDKNKTDKVIKWVPNGSGFTISSKSDFEKPGGILHKFYPQLSQGYTSFTRSLYNYNFYIGKTSDNKLIIKHRNNLFHRDNNNFMTIKRKKYETSLGKRKRGNSGEISKEIPTEIPSETIDSSIDQYSDPDISSESIDSEISKDTKIEMLEDNIKMLEENNKMLEENIKQLIEKNTYLENILHQKIKRDHENLLITDRNNQKFVYNIKRLEAEINELKAKRYISVPFMVYGEPSSFNYKDPVSEMLDRLIKN